MNTYNRDIFGGLKRLGSLATPILTITGLVFGTPACKSQTEAVTLAPQVVPVSSPGDLQQSQSTLKDMADTAAHLMRALGDIKREVTRQETVTMVDPDFDSPYFYDWNSAWDLTYPMPDDPIYTRDTGKLLAPRKPLLDRLMSEVNSWCQLLQQEVNAVQLPDSDKVQLEVLNDTMQNIHQHCQELQVLTEVKDVDNQAVANKATVIRDDVAGVDALRKRFAKQLKQS